MKTILTSIAAGGLLAALAMAQASYTVTDLGVVGGSPGQVSFITDNGLVSGTAPTPDGRMQNALWYKGNKMNMGTAGLGGPDSAAFAVNKYGQVVGQALSSTANSEDFCGFKAYGFPSTTACLPFVWQFGVMTKLPTLGGANGWANWINNRGDVAGLAQNTTKDPGCPVGQFKPVIWENNAIRELPTFTGDSYGVAAAINDNGQAVGASGACAPFNPPAGNYLQENHALLWEYGTVTDLGNLGGIGGLAGNHACALNNRGQVVGHSQLGSLMTSAFHGFLWTRDTGMLDLGTLPGDFASLGLGINDRGVVVGASLDPMFNPRAIVWENGVITDLNTLVAANPSGLYLLEAASINSRGEIVGVALANGAPHGFLATPSNR